MISFVVPLLIWSLVHIASHMWKTFKATIIKNDNPYTKNVNSDKVCIIANWYSIFIFGICMLSFTAINYG